MIRLVTPLFRDGDLIGYEATFSPVLSVTIATLLVQNLQLSTDGITLKTATVTAEKPLIVQRIDRTVINLENRVATVGNSALDLLEKLPGVVVNRANNSIAVLGKDGVSIMVNGRLQYVSGDALFSYLVGITADNISTVELINTPPAEFDAEGNAGFIN